jgi:putative ATP-dependent endonuclease of the OLD family
MTLDNKKMSLENFRSFGDRTEIDLHGINIFVGPNKAGKSNIIMCLRFLNSLSRNDWNNSYPENVFDYDTNKRITIEIVLSLSYFERNELLKRLFPEISEINYDNNPIFKGIKYLLVVEDNKIYHEKVSAMNTTGEYKDLIIHQFEGGVPNQLILDLGCHSNIRQINEFDGIKLEKKIGKWQSTKSIFHVEKKTAEYLVADLMRDFFQHKIAFFSSVNIQKEVNLEDVISDQIQNAIRYYPQFLELVSEIIDISNIRYDHKKGSIPVYNESDEERLKYHRLGFNEDGLKSTLGFRSLSYGSQQLLHLLVLIEYATIGNIICIEEPENHLHSQVQKKFFKRIINKSKEKGIQFFITTHSPIFTGLESGTIITYLITRTGAISKATSIENDSQMKLIKQHLGIENSDIYLSPWVVFVEGPSEKIAFEMIAPNMGYNQIGKEVRIISFDGKDRLPRLTDFLTYIHYFDTKAIVIADGHDNIIKHIAKLKRMITLSFTDKTRQKDKEFEDLFDDKTIINAMSNLSKVKSFMFEMSENELQTKRKEKNVASILEDYMRETNGHFLDKTSLARELSLIIIRDIKENKIDRSKSEIEKEIDDVMNIIDPDVRMSV